MGAVVREATSATVEVTGNVANESESEGKTVDGTLLAHADNSWYVLDETDELLAISYDVEQVQLPRPGDK